ncbi:MAG: hypothetical protein ACPG6B_10105 [Oceanihabitans sp.]
MNYKKQKTTYNTNKKNLRQVLLFLFSLSIYNTYAQESAIKLPEFPKYFSKTTDTIAFYKNGGIRNGAIKEIHKYIDAYHIDSKFFNSNKDPITNYGEKLHLLKPKNDSIVEIYFLNTNPNEEYSYREVDENNYYLGQIITYDKHNRIRTSKKILDNLSEELIEYSYNNNNQLVSITQKEFLSLEAISNDGIEILEISLPLEPTNIKTTTAVYSNNRLSKITSVEQIEQFENTFYETKTYNYYSGTKVREVLLEYYTINKETNKNGTVQSRQLRLFYNTNNTIKETILNYKDDQDRSITQTTNYRQRPALNYKTIKVTTTSKSNKDTNTQTESITIKSDEKQNVTEVINTLNKTQIETITFKYKYY